MWMRSLARAGADVLIVPITEGIHPSLADAVEIQHIAKYRELGCDLTNRTDGGRGRLGRGVSDDTRRKMSESAKRRPPRGEEARRRFNESWKANPNNAAKLAVLHKRNIGRERTPEWRRRISESLRGERNGQNVVTWEFVDSIRERYAAGAVQMHLAREFGCSPATVNAIVHNKRWVRE